MLLFEMCEIGNKLLAIRKKQGLTQAEVAELAGLSGRTYADIERGTVNMRVETILRVCKALQITPDEILTASNDNLPVQRAELLEKLNTCSVKNQETALRLLEVYLDSID